MGRGVGVLVVATIIVVSGGLAALVIWQAEAGHISLRSIRYATGGLMLVVGAGFTALHLSIADERLRQRFGESAAIRVRHLWRSGWIGAMIGSAIIAAEYVLGTGR